MSDERIPLCTPLVDGNARRYLQECLDSNYVSSVGPFVTRFEREFALAVGSPSAVACCNGTAALHIALKVAGVEAGDEVLVSDFTFIATVNPVAYLGGIPVLVDAENGTWNMDPNLVTQELETRGRLGARQPKAVLVAHVLGVPADIAPIQESCEKYGVALLEDAAEALGGSYVNGPLAGRQVGSIGMVGCFSFNGNKVITTGGGGMLTTDNPSVADRARHLTTQARLPGPEYLHDELGYNYRLTNLAAALGVAQLERLEHFLTRKRQIAERYDSAFGCCAGITLPPRPEWAKPTHWLYSILIEPSEAGIDRTSLMLKLADAGVETRPLWAPAHKMRFYHQATTIGAGRVGDRLFSQGLSLPSSVSLTESQQDRVIESVLDSLG
jgi:dTDP-4-amino-4,6-dideoxygalactose transaminase